MLYSAMYCSASAGGARDRQVHLGGNALGEALRQPRLRPLAARPLLAVGEPLLERREREVQQHDEGELVLEEVVADVRRGIVAGQHLVEGIDRPEVEVRLPAEVAGDLEHVPVDRLEHELHPVEEGVERLRVAGEVRPDQVLERRRVAVLRAPELGHLIQPS